MIDDNSTRDREDLVAPKKILAVEEDEDFNEHLYGFGPDNNKAEQEPDNDFTNERPGTERWMLHKSQQIYRDTTDYLNGNISSQWDENLSHFRSEHSDSSNYASEKYVQSKVFRPKSRANTKAQEAACSVAMFGTKNLLVVEPLDPTNEMQIASAEVNQYILQYRLDRRMPWMFTTLGAYQDTKVYGICISHQYWRYEVDDEVEPAYDDAGNMIIENGVPMGEKKRVIRHDDLVCDLIEPENFRFDPSSDWRDPAGTSPYIQYIMPIKAGDVLERMQRIDPKTGKTIWRKRSLEQILSTRKDMPDVNTRQSRQGSDRVDPTSRIAELGDEFTTLFAHMNICKVNGEDYVWWTLGTDLVLSHTWEKLRDAYPHLRQGERPFVVGFSNIETHRNYPAGDVELGAGLQEEINAVANQRLDNVKLVLNKRYFIRRGAGADLDALVRNVPGGGILTNNPKDDVIIVDTPDVTKSSYEEQDRLSVEFDELLGAFSSSSVQANQSGDQTSGGMEMLRNSAGAVKDYGLSLFIKSWVEPALDQMLRLVQMYETDEVLFSLAANKARLVPRFGVNQITDNLMRQSLIVRVDVGIGNTDPLRRVERLTYGVSQALALPGMQERLKSANVANEIFAALGYRSAERFFRNEQEQMEFVQANPPEPPPMVQIKHREMDVRENDNVMRDKREREKTQGEFELRRQELGMKARESDRGEDREAGKLAADMMDRRQQLDSKERLEREKIKAQRDIKAAEIADSQRNEALKRATSSTDKGTE